MFLVWRLKLEASGMDFSWPLTTSWSLSKEMDALAAIYLITGTINQDTDNLIYSMIADL